MLEIADFVKNVSKTIDNKDVEILLEEKDINLWAGMDSELFCSEFDWAPQYDIIEMVERVYLQV